MVGGGGRVEEEVEVAFGGDEGRAALLVDGCVGGWGGVGACGSGSSS